MKIPGWKIVNLHCPHYRLRIRKLHYRSLLFAGGIAIYWVHYKYPEHEIHVVFLINTLFAFDPTA